MIKLIVVCFLGCLFIFTTSLTFAQKGKSAPVTKVHSPKTKHADRNADGIVTKKEAHIEKKKDDRFVNKGWEKKADTNQDGVVDNKELSQWKDKHSLDWEDKADLNNDGVIDDKELAMWKDKHPLPPDFKKEADLNNDGIVDDKELMLWKRKHPGTEEPQ